MNVRQIVKTCVLALACCCAATAWADQGRGETKRSSDRQRHVEYAHANDRPGNGDSYFHRHGYTRLNIPKGHYPPPGECRIWYPDRPPGHQPPPGDCQRLRVRVPPGAWLIRHPEDDAEHVHVAVYDDRRPGSILAIGQFSIGTGVFVRVVVNR